MRLAIICSHPIQYYSPWFRLLAQQRTLETCVFYLWDFGIKKTHDPGFKSSLQWDIPLLDGYPHDFVPNTARDPGTHHFQGLQNPELARRLHGWAPDSVLMLGYAFHSMLKLVLNRNLADIPFLLKGDSHRLVPDSSAKGRLKDFLASALFRRFSAFLYCGQANRDYFKHRGASDEQLFFSPHAIDMNRFQANAETQSEAAQWRRDIGVPQDARLILFAGKFEKKKRPLELLETFLRLNPKNTHLVFVGSGDLQQQLYDRAGKNAAVHFAPFHNQSRMPGVYAAADLFVLPSFGPSETWGLAVQEALACGTPALVSDHVGCHADLIHSGRNGLVFKAGSPPELEHALSVSLAPDRLEQWKREARPSLENYTYAQATRGLLQALEFVKGV